MVGRGRGACPASFSAKPVDISAGEKLVPTDPLNTCPPSCLSRSANDDENGFFLCPYLVQPLA
jgi:hypothetical protein